MRNHILYRIHITRGWRVRGYYRVFHIIRVFRCFSEKQANTYLFVLNIQANSALNKVGVA